MRGENVALFTFRPKLLSKCVGCCQKVQREMQQMNTDRGRHKLDNIIDQIGLGYFEGVSCWVWYYSHAEGYFLKSLFPSLNITGLWVIPNLNFRFIFPVVFLSSLWYFVASWTGFYVALSSKFHDMFTLGRTVFYACCLGSTGSDCPSTMWYLRMKSSGLKWAEHNFDDWVGSHFARLALTKSTHWRLLLFATGRSSL